MYVLQNALDIVFRTKSEDFLCFVVPCIGEVGYLKISGEKSLLQLEAQDDVQVVSYFVGVHSGLSVPISSAS